MSDNHDVVRNGADITYEGAWISEGFLAQDFSFSYASIQYFNTPVGGPIGGTIGGLDLYGGGVAAKGAIVLFMAKGPKNPIREILKLPRKLLNKPKKRGNAPTFKKDGKSVDIHHINQNPAGPFKEMHPKMHRGKGYHGRRHPNKVSRIDHKDFKKAKKAYWRRVFDLWGK